ncbi:hypothetical protein [Desulforhopalus sp. IMCC35007]|uniref:hypothetical protein n=1 Tax=Desulforhopalus sp. IMCC35007 TaxID=2569543 RepID=UPI0010AEA240|nr:hypothetical protein [Desulforhopalus sp. IMCC35007]TKB09349.1 hypothetical protein FCL48_10355 [Desulforhopalus sp. IMCC35007]
MNKTTDNRYLISAVFFTLTCFYGFFPTVAQASSVTGRYLSHTGPTIVLEISISKPTPSSIIVEQSIAKSNTIQSVSPNPKKVTKNGQIKWLLTNLRPGKQRLTTQLSGQLNGNVRGVLRYRDPDSGQFTEVIITP